MGTVKRTRIPTCDDAAKAGAVDGEDGCVKLEGTYRSLDEVAVVVAHIGEAGGGAAKLDLAGDAGCEGARGAHVADGKIPGQPTRDKDVGKTGAVWRRTHQLPAIEEEDKSEREQQPA